MSALRGLLASEKPLRLEGVQLRSYLQSAGVVGKAVADIVQAQRVGKMGIDH